MFILLTQVLVFPIPTAMAPIPPNARQVIFYSPTQVKAKRVYNYGDEEVTVIVTKVTAAQGGAVQIAQDVVWHGEKAWSERFLVEDGKLTRLCLNGEELDTPHCFFNSKLKAGEQWIVEPSDPKQAKSVYIVGDSEDIAIPAGRFQCVKIEVRCGVRRSLCWFSPGVGLVKEAVQTEDGKWSTSKTLKSVDFGKN